MAQFRRGAAALAASSSNGGGNFTPYVPDIRWREDGEKKFILVLTPIGDVVGVDLHEFVKLPSIRQDGKPRYEHFISRNDPNLNEGFDRLEDELGHKARTRTIGVAVELTPVMKDVNGRKRPGSFTVKTETFTRKGDDGEEEVEKPLIGLIIQSNKLMWGPLNGLDESSGPLIDLPIQVTKRGEKAETTYEMVPFMDIPVDLSGVADYFEGISYLRDDVDTINGLIDGKDDTDAAQAIADFLMNKRIDELADLDRYEEILGDIEEIELAPWEKDNKKKAAPKKAAKRSARPSQRKANTDTVDEGSDESEDTPVAEAEEEPKEEAPAKSDRFASLKARVEGSK